MSTIDDPPPESGAGAAPTSTSTDPYQQMQASPEFAALRRRWRRVIFTMSAVFLGWFFLYVLLADYATGFMNITLGDTTFTVGLIFGLLQFVSTFVIATAYVRFADKHLDPEAARLRATVEEKL